MLLFWRIVGLAVPRHLGRARFCSHELSLSLSRESGCHCQWLASGYIPQIWGMMISPLSSFIVNSLDWRREEETILVFPRRSVFGISAVAQALRLGDFQSYAPMHRTTNERTRIVKTLMAQVLIVFSPACSFRHQKEPPRFDYQIFICCVVAIVIAKAPRSRLVDHTLPGTGLVDLAPSPRRKQNARQVCKKTK